MAIREPILHDRQRSFSTGSQAISSASGFVDVTGAMLVAKDLGSPGCYDVDFFPIISVSSSNTTVTFRSLVNNVASGDDVSVLVKTSGIDASYPIVGIVDNVVLGDEVQVQLACDKGTTTISNFIFRIDGIPEIRVVT